MKLIDGKAEGSLNTRIYETDDEFNFISLLGEREGTLLRLKAVHVKNGEVIEFGRFDLDLIEDPLGNNLRWRTLEASPYDEYFQKDLMLMKIEIEDEQK